MKWRFLAAFGLAAVLVGLCLAAFLSSPPSIYPEMKGHKRFMNVEVCEGPLADCSQDDAYRAVSLPHFPRPDIINERVFSTYRLDIAADDVPDVLPAIFFPRFSDTILISINDVMISPDRRMAGRLIHNWNRPYYSTFSKDLIDKDQNRVLIQLEGYEYSQLNLNPFYIGPARALEFKAQITAVARLGYARMISTFVLFLGVAVLFLWAHRRHDRPFFWIGVACLSSVIYLFQISMPNFYSDALNWLAFWNATILLFAYCVLRYVMSLYDIRPRWSHTAVMAAGWIATVAIYFLTPSTVLLGIGLYHILTAIIGLSAIALLILHWGESSFIQRMHIPIFSICLAAAATDYLYYIYDPEFSPNQWAQFANLLLCGGIFAILFTRLAGTLKNYETLTNSMQTTIEDRTQELAIAQAKVLEAEKNHAIDSERQRIMLDLHDGVGGQLVNVLAYMGHAESVDPVVETALQDALQDMALIIDSLEGSDDLSMLLGSLRERMEAVIQRSDCTLVWDTKVVMAFPDATKALNMIRIVQEALTNAVKHAQASEITLMTGTNWLRISDNGVGFAVDQAAKKSGTNSGIGLKGMQRRATEVGANLDVHSNEFGTTITVSWEPSDLEVTPDEETQVSSATAEPKNLGPIPLQDPVTRS
ncbi:MAG: sensor histidine kinase [Planktomarina sp.]